MMYSLEALKKKSDERSCHSKVLVVLYIVFRRFVQYGQHISLRLFVLCNLAII